MTDRTQTPPPAPSGMGLEAMKRRIEQQKADQAQAIAEARAEHAARERQRQEAEQQRREQQRQAFEAEQERQLKEPAKRRYLAAGGKAEDFEADWPTIKRNLLQRIAGDTDPVTDARLRAYYRSIW